MAAPRLRAPPPGLVPPVGRGVPRRLDGRVGRGVQERSPLAGRIAADIKEARPARAKRSDVLLAVDDAARAAALVPTLGLLDQPAAPKREPLLAGKRPRTERFEVDSARQAPKPPPLEPQE